MKQLLYRLKYSLSRFMTGRYGNDPFNKFLLYGGLVLWVISIILTGIAKQAGVLMIIATIVYYIAFAAIVWSLVRSLSKNTAKRAAENRWYLNVKSKVTGKWKVLKRSFQDRKTYRYFSCPQCGKTVRVPKGKGKIRITCPQCANEFIKKS